MFTYQINIKKFYLKIRIIYFKGDNMNINTDSGNVYSFTVNVMVTDSSLSAATANCDASKDYNYSSCVDDIVNTDLIPQLNCTPPWLSTR